MLNLLIVIFLATFIVVDMKLFKNSKKASYSLLKSVLIYIVTIKIAHMLPFLKIYEANTLVPLNVWYGFVILFIVVMLGYLFIEQKIMKKITIKRKESRWPLWLKIFIVVMIALSNLLIFFTTWFKDFFGQLSPEQFLFNLQSPISGASESMNMQIIFNPIFNTLFFTLIVGSLVFSKYRIQSQFTIVNKKLAKFLCQKSIVCIVSLIYLISSALFFVYTLKIDQIIAMYTEHSQYIANNYVDIRQVKVEFPKKKRNVIHIYYESVENSYFDKLNGGYMDENLMPDLLEVTKEGINFSQHNQIGGPNQTHGSGWSVAGFVNMESGVPLKIASNNTTYGLDGFFLPGIYHMGDFLHDNGYNQTVMLGSDASFGGLDVYFTSHGKYKIFDLKYAKKVGLLPLDYHVWWGFEDDKLYVYAKDELTKLAQSDKPFNFVLETADTHFPNGYLPEGASQKYESPYANAIAYSSRQLANFIKWIQQQSWYDNTTIIITGDHLSMDKEFFKSFDPNYHRTVYNVFLNSAISTTFNKNRQFSPIDFYPTILASMGIMIEGNRAGLGTNLFSGLPTLIERDGLDTFNEELRKNSHFFNEQFMSTNGKEKIVLPN